MTKISSTSSLNLCLICYPYSPSKDRGRGLDRYMLELLQNVPKVSVNVKLRHLHQGPASSILTAGTKVFKLIADLLFSKDDVYHAMTPIGGAVAALLCKSPLIVTIHDMLPFNSRRYDYGWKLWFMRLCTRISVKQSTVIIVPYEITKKELVARFKIKDTKIHVVNYGVDHNTYYVEKDDRKVSGRIVYIGEVSRSKGVDSLIKAFAIVKQRAPEAELLIGGKTSRDTPWIEQMSRDLNLTNITFLGYVPEGDLRKHYASATVMVFPSRSGFGLSTLEAMACGTPVIVGGAFDAPEFVGDGGILVHPDDIDEIAETILRVLTEPGFRALLSAKAIERAKTFSWDKTAQETVVIYRHALHS